MQKRVRIKDIAEQAGVSVGTVDRVLHNRGNVAEEVQQRVLQTLDEMGYERNLLASALAYNRALRIVALLPDYSIDPYWEQPYSGVITASKNLQHYGLQVQIKYFNLFDPADFLAKAREVLEEQPEGLLFPPLFLNEGKWLLNACRENNIATVTFNTQIEDSTGLCYIGQDSFQSGVLAARLLSFALKGHETVMVLNLEIGITNARHILEKERGFRDYFARHGSHQLNIVRCDFEDFTDQVKLQQFVRQKISELPDLAGIFVSNSRAYMLVECLDEAMQQQIKIVGYDLLQSNIEYLYGEKINFLVNQNSVEQGYQSIMTLFRHLFLKEDIGGPNNFLPLDIVVAENAAYYLEKQAAFQVVV